MLEDEPPLSPDERLTIVALYARLTTVTPLSRLRLDSGLTSLDVSPPRQHLRDEENSLVGQSHILVSHHLSHNTSHQDAS
ncbi:hypothetical protein D2E27_13885 [Mycobacteroides abscessus]|nr:hypothetical protein DDJ40_15300 [Mycobacteroides abscessus]RIR12439.1 hypothetical protein D2E27_13885 [Mycobacteroides abscessus]